MLADPAVPRKQAEDRRRAPGPPVNGGTRSRRQHPGHLGPDDFDLAGAATGVVEADALLGPDKVRPGDVVLALASSGLHANGYSLVRRVIAEADLALDAEPPGLGRTLGEELLTPTTIYARDCLALAAGCDVHAFAHVTGGGLAGNLARVLPPETGATVDRETWRPPAIFSLLAGHGGIGTAGLPRTRWSACSTWASAWSPS